MGVKFGVLIRPESVAGTAELAKLAEDHGFDRVRLGDWISTHVADKAGFIRAWGTHVITRFTG